jgi:hypothetical protein
MPILPLLLTRNWRLFAILGTLVALIGFIYFWRAEIYKAAEGALKANITQTTIERNQQSRKEADNVTRQERKITDIDRALCSLNVMREQQRCNSQ